MPPSVNVRLSGSQPFGTAYVEPGSLSPIFNGRYLRAGVWHFFVYQSLDRESCLQQYLAEIGLSRDNVIFTPGERHAPDFELRPDLDRRFSRRGTMKVVVEYKRRGVTHWFEFDDEPHSQRLQRYIEQLGLSVFDVKVTVLTVPDEEFDDFLDLA